MTRMEARLLCVVFVGVAIALGVCGCAPSGDEPSPADTGDDSGTSDAANEIANSSEKIDIGGRSLYLKCWGEQIAGEPTVLLIAGQGPTTSSWELMAREFATDGHSQYGAISSCKLNALAIAGADRVPTRRPKFIIGLLLLGQLHAGCDPRRGRHMEIAKFHAVWTEHYPVGIAFIVGQQYCTATRNDGNNFLAAARRRKSAGTGGHLADGSSG